MGNGKVLVTGATGYVAGHCIRELLDCGYGVRGTVRSLKTADVTYLPDIELAQATLDDDAGWAEAVAGCDYVLHVASPIPFKAPRSEDEIIRPAVDGTIRVLRAAAGSGVRRVVCTSSLDAVTRGSASAGQVRTDEDWSEPGECGVYGKSKVLAERAAWNFAAEQGLEVSVILPGAVIGPPLQLKKSSSVDIVRRMLAGEMIAVPGLKFAFSDVRDLAVAHRLAMERPGAAGNRYICASEHLWMTDVAGILKAEYGPKGYPVSTRPLPSWILRAAALFSDEARLAADMLGSQHHVSAEKARRELGWSARPIREAILDTAEMLISHGLVAPKGRRHTQVSAAAVTER